MCLVNNVCFFIYEMGVGGLLDVTETNVRGCAGIFYYPAGKAVFPHCGIKSEAVTLVSARLCDETCMHAPMR